MELEQVVSLPGGESDRMQNRGRFLATVATMPIVSVLGLGRVGMAASSLLVASENDLIKRIDPSVWVSWGKGNFPNADGATDKNLPGYLQVGFQYHTFNLIPYALVHRSTHFLDGACLVAEYAFRHQNGDGSFPYYESNGAESSGTAPNPESPASSLTFFFYDFGHSMLVLSGDTWFTQSDEAAPYRARLASLKPKIVSSLNWLLTQRNVLATDRSASNRTLAHGLAYYFVGKAVGRSDAMSLGKKIVSDVLDNVAMDVFPESGGFDSSYQGANILECQWLALHLEDEPELRNRLWMAIQSGLKRERVAIAPTGEVSTAGNTRISASGESYFGHRKTVNSKQVMLAFAYYGEMAGDALAKSEAARIQSFYGLPVK